MYICLFEDDAVSGLRPLVETRAAYDLRLGLHTVLEMAWNAFPPAEPLLHTRPLVASVTEREHDVPVNPTLPSGEDILFVNGRFVATSGGAVEHIAEYVRSDRSGRTFTHGDRLVAAWVPDATTHLPDDLLSSAPLPREPFSSLPTTQIEDPRFLRRPWNVLDTLHPVLQEQMANWRSQPPTSPLSARSHATVHDSVVSVHPENIYLEPGAEVRPGAVLNAEHGSIVIDADATVYERAVVHGPCYVGPKSEIKVGASIENAAFGYWCKVGGEVHDTIIQSLSNKAHPGFLGHAYLGRWCNLGADTNNSNLRNDYGDVDAYAPAEEAFISTNRQFAGLFMGDHSKCSINTMFDTGTVVGTFCNLYGAEFPPRYVPPFSWGGSTRGFTTYRLQKALAVAERVMSRRDMSLSDAHKELLTSLHRRTEAERDEHLK